MQRKKPTPRMSSALAIGHHHDKPEGKARQKIAESRRMSPEFASLLFLVISHATLRALTWRSLPTSQESQSRIQKYRMFRGILSWCALRTGFTRSVSWRWSWAESGPCWLVGGFM